jgi:TonB family protein
MDKLQKKCFVATAIMHGLLLFVMVVGTAFFNSEKKPVDVPRILEIRDFKLTDGNTHGGGSPTAVAPAPAPAPEPKPVQPQPTPAPQPVPEVKKVEPEPAPEPKREPVVEPKPKVVEPKNDVSELPVPKKTKTTKVEHTPKPAPKPNPYKSVKRNIDISKPVVRDTRQKEIESQRAAEAAARRAAEQRARDLRSAFNGVRKNLENNLSSATTFDSAGFGGGGIAEVNYGEYVLNEYDNKWIAPAEIDSNEAVVKARVVIARSGRVISSEIIRRSQNPSLDKSVQRALDAVPSVRPFPEGSTDSQRTYIINFNIKSKRGIG